MTSRSVLLFLVLETLLPHARAYPGDANTDCRIRTTAQQPGPAQAPTGDPGFVVYDWDKLTPAQRTAHKQKAEAAAQERAKKDLPDGWVVKRMGRFLVLNHDDEKFAKKIVERSEAVLSWLDSNFPLPGEKEYVRSPVLRICKDAEEYNAFQSRISRSWNNIELVCYDDRGTNSRPMRQLISTLVEIWFEDRDRDLWFGMPLWLQNGITDLLQEARLEKGKVEFRYDFQIKDSVRDAALAGKTITARTILSTADEAFWKDPSNYKQGSALVAFLATGPAAKAKLTKEFLPGYLAALKGVLSEITAEARKDGKPPEEKPTTAEEEDAQLKSQRDAMQKKSKRILDQTLERRTSDWSPDDWKKFEELFAKTFR